MTRSASLIRILFGVAILVFVAVLARTMDVSPAILASTGQCSHVGKAECGFLFENKLIMDKMMDAMEATPTGAVDADFANMMIPHHQGAIDMAVLELRYGRNEQLRRIAQGIIVEQQQEIDAMRLVLGESRR
jgi:uncharacterized protein (DUF305 family)